MRMCLKCSKKVSDDSKICRDCGAILEDIPDDSVPGTGSEWKPASQLGSPWTAEPWKSRQEEGDEQSVGRGSGGTVLFVKVADDEYALREWTNT